jgi:hypothetical protein
MTRIFPVLDAISGWRLAPDTPPPLAAYPQEVLVMSVLDETGLPPEVPLAASTATTGLLARADADGLAGLAGIPLTRFLATSVIGAALQLTLDGAGYITLSLSTTLGGQAGYPDAFAPANLDTVTLHRAPVIIAGRVVDASQASLNNAAITVNGVWPTMASLQNPAPAAPNLIALLSPLYADRDATATVAAQNLTAGAPTKTLLLPGNVGDTTLRLSDQVGLALSSIIGLDQQDPQQGEYVSVVSITQAGATPQQPATAMLPFPLARPHALGTAAIPMTPAAAGAANALARPAQVGDVTMFPAAMSGLDDTMSAVVVAGGGVATVERHAASLYVAPSDVNGHMVLPAVHRLAQLQLRVHHPSQATDLLTAVILPFGVKTITLNLAFP